MKYEAVQRVKAKFLNMDVGDISWNEESACASIKEIKIAVENPAVWSACELSANKRKKQKIAKSWVNSVFESKVASLTPTRKLFGVYLLNLRFHRSYQGVGNRFSAHLIDTITFQITLLWLLLNGIMSKGLSLSTCRKIARFILQRHSTFTIFHPISQFIFIYMGFRLKMQVPINLFQQVKTVSFRASTNFCIDRMND